MKNVFLLLSIVSILAYTAKAQERNCGTSIYENYLEELDPDYPTKKRAIFEEAKTLGAQQRSGVVVTIPVVVHIVYKTNTENISDAQINSQLAVLNKDFRRTNNDASQTPSFFAGLADDAEIEFCLATVDPSGAATTGITRTQTWRNDFSVPYSAGAAEPIKLTASGGKDAWDSNKYLNMWVCNMTGGVLGYATFPGSVSADKDGVVIGYNYFGSTGAVSAPYNRGRTTTHEVGHYLGLPHIWGDGACGADDGIADTPVASASYGGCPSFPQTSCGTSDMFMNYMDYVNDACMNMFSQGQVAVMRGILNGQRSALIGNASTACGGVNPPQCQNLVTSPLQMGFETNEDFSAWQIVDANNDAAANGSAQFSVATNNASNSEWGSRTGDQHLVYLWSATSAADDWLFTPCISLLDGHIYEFSYWYCAAADDYGTYPEKLEVGVSTDQTVAGVYQTLVPEVTITNVYPTYLENKFTITAPNDVEISLGFHATSDADQYALQLDDINITDITFVSNENLVEENLFNVYPNPATEVLNLAIDSDKMISDAQVKIIDMTGRTMLERSFTNLQSDELTFDISNYANGVYLVNLIADGELTTKKVVIAK